MFDLSALPDNLYGPDVPTSAWTDRVETSSGHKFPSGSLGKLSPVPWKAQLERLIGIPIYLMLNWLPFLLPLVCFAVGGARGLAILAAVLASLTLRPVYTLLGSMLSCIPLALGVPKAQLSGQYVYTERNNQKYLSMRMVWGEAFERYRTTKAGEGRPVIFAIIPHGIAPLGVTGYPAWSRLCGGVCRWTAAPVVLKIPLVGPMLRSIGYVEAKGKAISGALSKGDSVGIVLDGIAGMFQQSDSIEKGYVLQRKAIAALALRANCAIVPVYGFGHTSLWTVVTDPFGLLERLSIALNVSVCPFYGRWGWPLGAPRRQPVLVAIGDPIECGSAPSAASDAPPTKEQVAEMHARLVEGFTKTFDEFKDEYGWGDKELKLV